MPDADPVLELTLAWLTHATTDLRAATLLLEDAVDLTSSVAFHAQQAIEKCLKAILVADQIDFGRTHQLTALATRIPDSWNLDLPVDRFPRITQYAAETRYPIDDWNEVEPVTVAEARDAVDTARAVLEQVTQALRRRGYLEPN